MLVGEKIDKIRDFVALTGPEQFPATSLLARCFTLRRGPALGWPKRDERPAAPLPVGNGSAGRSVAVPYLVFSVSRPYSGTSLSRAASALLTWPRATRKLRTVRNASASRPELG